MSTDKMIQIVCDICGERSELVDVVELSETELRRDLVKRFGWLSIRTDVPRGRKDVCPTCQHCGGRR